jgi:hypothetical protein
MLLDKQNEFSDSQAVTATAISTNVIDTMPGNSFTNVVQNLGGFAGAAFLVVQVDTTFTAGGAATLTISLESDSTANLATSPTVHFSTAALAVATLTAGRTLLVIPLPLGDFERYLGVRYTVATGPMTAGAISAFLTRDPQTWKPYAVASASNL